MSQLRRAMQHPLKLEHSPSAGPRRQWMVTVRGARSEATKRMTGKIRAEVSFQLQAVYEDARRLAAAAMAARGETDAARNLPDLCPYTLDQLLDRGWHPANRHGLVDEGDDDAL